MIEINDAVYMTNTITTPTSLFEFGFSYPIDLTSVNHG